MSTLLNLSQNFFVTILINSYSSKLCSFSFEFLTSKFKPSEKFGSGMAYEKAQTTVGRNLTYDGKVRCDTVKLH